MTAKRKVFLGRFIYPKTRDELTYLFGTAVCVDENGRIAAVEEGDWERVKSEVLPSLGWPADEVEMRSCGPEEFFFPGFVGECPPVCFPTRLEVWLTRKTPTSTPRNIPMSVSSESPPSSTG